MTVADLPDGWRVWSDQPARIVLAYRPDVFDESAFPAPCLPTIYVSKGTRSRRPGRDRPAPDADWHATLYLEPDVSRAAGRYDTREAAVDGAREVAESFARGDVDYRGLYQVPREAYLDRLDELTGSTPGTEGETDTE